MKNKLKTKKLITICLVLCTVLSASIITLNKTKANAMEKQNSTSTVTKGPILDFFTKKSIKRCDIYTEYNAYYYTGYEIKPDVLVYYKNKKLTQGIDYEVSYSYNIDVGTAAAIVKGIGSYRGEDKVYFTIEKRSIKNCTFRINPDEVQWTGQSHTPLITATYNGNSLTNGIDYTVKYGTNKDAGYGYIYVYGKGLFKDKLTLTFTIKGIDVNSCIAEYTNGNISVTYNNNQLIMNSDYTFKLYDTDKKLVDCEPAYKGKKNIYEIIYTYELRGKGQYTGTRYFKEKERVEEYVADPITNNDDSQLRKDVYKKIKTILSEYTAKKESSIKLEHNLERDLGISKLYKETIISYIESYYDISISESDSKKIKTVEDLLNETVKRIK